LTSFIVHRDL